MTTLTIIVAKASNNVIGFRNKMPWDIPADMKHFIKETTGKAVVMGRKTFESIGRPLPNRFNIVLTKQQGEIEGVKKCHNLAEAVDAASKAGYDELIVIGGQGLYQTAMPWVTKLIVTEIHKEYVGDAFFPNLPLEDWQEQFRSDVTGKDAATMEDISLSFVTYVRPGGVYKPDLNEPADILMLMSMNSAQWRKQSRKMATGVVTGLESIHTGWKLNTYANHFLDKETVEKLGLGAGVPNRDYFNAWTVSNGNPPPAYNVGSSGIDHIQSADLPLNRILNEENKGE